MLQTAEQEKKNDNGRKKILSVHSVSIWLDGYDDLFSDFDPRNYAERSISDDFITELKRHSVENELPVSEIKLLLPGNVRNTVNEEIISKRLRKHIQNLITLHEKKLAQRRRKGFLLILIGALLLLSAGYISGKLHNFMLRFLFVITEPAGWFFAWSGFEHLFSYNRSSTELDFYRKFSRTTIHFQNI